jgi:hypothetical protein
MFWLNPPYILPIECSFPFISIEHISTVYFSVSQNLSLSYVIYLNYLEEIYEWAESFQLIGHAVTVSNKKEAVVEMVRFNPILKSSFTQVIVETDRQTDITGTQTLNRAKMKINYCCDALQNVRIVVFLVFFLWKPGLHSTMFFFRGVLTRVRQSEGKSEKHG